MKQYFKFIKQFFKISTIHGIPFLSKKNLTVIEKVFWFLMILIGFYGSWILSENFIKRYKENPTVISMERDRFSWNITFPPITFCPSIKYDDKKLENYIEQSLIENKTKFQHFLITLLEANYDNFDKILQYDDFDPENYLDLILKLHYNFKSEITDAGSEIKIYEMKTVITEIGICYTFNSPLAVYFTPKYWINNQWDLILKEDIFNINPMDGEIFTNILNISTGFNLYFHGPYEVPDMYSKSIYYSSDGYLIQVYLTILTIFSSDNIRSLSINQRKCRFFDETSLKHFPIYSYNCCRMECRVILAQKLCGCIPHFYRKLDGEKVCNVSGLHCLANYKERLKYLKNECNCLPNCDEVNYIVEDMDAREWFIATNLQWGIREYPKLRLRRDIIFGFTDLLSIIIMENILKIINLFYYLIVYIGGMAGLFLGCSVLSFIEIIYFFTLRLFWYIKMDVI